MSLTRIAVQADNVWEDVWVDANQPEQVVAAKHPTISGRPNRLVVPVVVCVELPASVNNAASFGGATDIVKVWHGCVRCEAMHTPFRRQRLRPHPM